jgi:HD superfamily phosphohydrolase YqeK
VQHELDIQDRLVLDAIAAHTFWGGGANFDHPLSWCLRFADILEPYRRWDDHARWLRAGSPRLHALAYSGQLEAAACMHAGLLVHFFTEMNIPINPNLRRAYQERAARLPQAQAWFDLDLA